MLNQWSSLCPSERGPGMMIIPKLSSGCLLSAVLIQLMVSEEGDDHLIHN